MLLAQAQIIQSYLLYSISTSLPVLKVRIVVKRNSMSYGDGSSGKAIQMFFDLRLSVALELWESVSHANRRTCSFYRLILDESLFSSNMQYKVLIYLSHKYDQY